jgi:AhpD family alkylhydroperoxidase
MNAIPARESVFLDKSNPDIWAALNTVQRKVWEAARAAGLSKEITELANVRISQLNGCAYCLDLHGRLATGAGVPGRKLHVLPAWREAEIYSEVEQAALVVAEAVTLLPDEDERQAALLGARSILSEEQYAALCWQAAVMNAFNRISVISGHPVRPDE